MNSELTFKDSGTFSPNFHNVKTNEWLQKVKYRRLGKTDLILSTLSYGSGALGNFYGENTGLPEAIKSVQTAIKCGINYIDTSPWYGDSEAILGQALNGIPRSTYYIGTKVGRNFTPTWKNRFDFSHNAVLQNVENSLKKLNISYVDIIQVHDVEFCSDLNIILKETIPALESVVKAGKAKYIGITGYCLDTLSSIAEACSIDTVLSYARYNLHDMSLRHYVSNFEKRDIGIINASPLAMGLLSSRGPPSWHPGQPRVKKVARRASDFCSKNNCAIERLSLDFSTNIPEKNVATTLVSMPTEEYVFQNLEATASPLSSDEQSIQKKMFDMFLDLDSKGGYPSCHWEGVELKEYKKAMGPNLA